MLNQTTYNYIEVAGVNIFYREAGAKDVPTLVLLHGYPSSSFMFKNLIEQLSDKYHLIAPDYPVSAKANSQQLLTLTIHLINLRPLLKSC